MEIGGVMKVSVICPNHGRNITELRRSLDNSNYKDLDVLVIDRGKERATQRNEGISEAVGEAFLFLDSDQSVSPGLIEECVGLLNEGFDAIYIPEIIVADGFFAKIRNFDRSFMDGTKVDAVRFVRAEGCPCFDEEQKGTEDSDFDRRVVGKRAISINVLFHHDSIGFLQYFSKKAYYARSLRRFSERNPNDPILNPWYRCVKVYTENGKWKKLLLHPVLSIGIILILLLRGIIYVTNK